MGVLRSAIAARPVAAFIILATGFSWLAWLPLLLVDAGLIGSAPAELHLVGSVGPAVAALIVVAARHGRRGLSALGRRALQWRAGRVAWLVALGAPMFVLACAMVGAWIGSAAFPAPGAILRLAEYPWLGPIGVLLAEIVFYGFGEEIGWRGFLMPRLAHRRGLLFAASLTSIPWAIWHVPLLIHNETYQSLGPAMLVGWYASLLLGCYLMAWLWRAGWKSIMPLAVFHGLLDVAMANPGLGSGGQMAGGAASVVLGLAALVLLKRRAGRSGGPFAKPPAIAAARSA